MVTREHRVFFCEGVLRILGDGVPAEDRAQLREWADTGKAPPQSTPEDEAAVLELVQLLADAEQRGRRELTEALDFLDIHARVNLVGQARHLPANAQNVLALARELGWPGIEPSKQGAADE